MSFKKRRYLLIFVTLVILLGSHLFSPPSQPTPGEAAQGPAPKYIFIFLADGAGINHLEIARQYSRTIHNEGLLIADKIMKEGSLGLMTTHSADSLVTDSAAAATALAMGCKTRNGMCGTCADGSKPQTVLEAAKAKGMRIGLVTNAAIYDASPAAFAGHFPDRKLYSRIVDRYLRLEPDLLLGGGKDYFLPRGEPGSRRQDDADMIGAFKKEGYAYVSNKSELAETKGAKVLGLFSLGEMSFEIERDQESEPSIYDMTKATIRLLQEGNRRGFVVFIENEHIDTAAHLSDIAALIRDFREFDRAVGLAYEFYQQRPHETLLLVTSDHETGGLGFTGMTSPEIFKKISSIRISTKKAAEKLGKRPSAKALERLLAEHFRGFSLTPELKEAILEQKRLGPTFYTNPTALALGAMVAKETRAYWLTSGHTNQPVFVTALGVGAERFSGYQDNTDVAKNLLRLIQGRSNQKPVKSRAR